jgi:hypothetical protein
MLQIALEAVLSPFLQFLGFQKILNSKIEIDPF